jgi:hypothetical protein
VTTGEHASIPEHLAEMDRLLRDIQVELDPTREPAPALEASPPLGRDAPDYGALGPEVAEEEQTPPEPAKPTAQLHALSQLAARLVASMRELLDGYEQFLVQIPAVDVPPPPAPAPSRMPIRPPAAPPRRDEPDVTVAAGPFASLDALCAFEQAVSGLPGVRDVVVRGYEGADRAIIEVQLERT